MIYLPHRRKAFRSTGTDLKTDLYDWWEDGDQVGKHASNDLGAFTNTDVSGPSPWTNAFHTSSSDDKDAIFGGTTIPPEGDFTIAFVFANNSDVNARYLYQSVSNYDHVKYVAAGNKIDLGSEADSNNTVASSIDDTGVTWYSLVVTKDNGVETKAYWNGTLAVTVDISAGTTPTSWFKALHDDDFYVACVATATRVWAQADVDDFHNSGNFIDYANL